MRAKDVMSNTVISVQPDAKMLQAARQMLQHQSAVCPWSTRAERSSAFFLRVISSSVARPGPNANVHMA